MQAYCFRLLFLFSNCNYFCRDGTLEPAWVLHQGEGRQRPQCVKGRGPKDLASRRHWLLRVVAATASTIRVDGRTRRPVRHLRLSPGQARRRNFHQVLGSAAIQWTDAIALSISLYSGTRVFVAEWGHVLRILSARDLCTCPIWLACKSTRRHRARN